MNDQILKNAYDLILNAKNILLVAHLNPDGDAIASVCAMAEFLRMQGIKYTAYCHNEPPHQFGFMPCSREFSYKIGSDKAENVKFDLDFGSFDLIMTFDCGSITRTMLAKEINERRKDQKIIEFDHHPKVEEYADIEIRNPATSSTSEIVYDFFKVNHIRINKNIAQAILTGISTDTGNFLYPSTSDKTIKISSEMLVYGANLPKVIENTWRNKSIATMKLWGRIMSNIKINKRYNLAVTALLLPEVEEMKVDLEELEGISSFLGNLKGVKGVLFLRQTEKNIIRGSLRTSLPDFDISKLAEALGGGGHPKSSGFRMEGEIIETENGWKVI